MAAPWCRLCREYKAESWPSTCHMLAKAATSMGMVTITSLAPSRKERGCGHEKMTGRRGYGERNPLDQLVTRHHGNGQHW